MYSGTADPESLPDSTADVAASTADDTDSTASDDASAEKDKIDKIK